MAEPASNLSPEDLERIRQIKKDIAARQIRPVDGIRKKPDPNYLPPDLQMVEDDEEEESTEGEEEYAPPDLQMDEDGEDEDQQPDISREDIERLKKKEQPRVKETPDQQLEKGEVPKYQTEPPGAYKEPPGGPAIKPKAPVGTTAKAEQGAAGTARSAASAGQKTAQAAVKTGQAIAKAVQATIAAVSRAIAAIGALIETAPAWVPIVLIILGILIIVGGVVIFLKARQTPNANGASPTIAADILNDQPLIQTVLALSSQQNMQELLTNNKQKLITDLQNFKAEIEKKTDDSRVADSVAKIDQALTLINQYDQPDAQKAQEIKELLIAIAKPWSVILNPGGLIFPVAGFNAQNKGRGQDYLNKGTHRGIDRGLPIGTLLRAAADGEVVYLTEDLQDNVDLGDNANGGFGNTIIIRITADNAWNGYLYEYHHIKRYSARELGIKKGSAVKQGDPIAHSGHNGKSSDPHLHFQIDKPEAINSGLPVGEGRQSETVDPYSALGWSR